MNVRMLSGLLLPMLLLLSGCPGGDGGTSGITEGTATSTARVYVVNQGNTNVSAYTINSTNGVLTEALPRANTGLVPKGISVNRAGTFVYVTNGGDHTVSAYAINSTTGALTIAGTTTAVPGTTPTGVTVDPTGKFVYVTNQGDDTVSAYSINSTTGVLTHIGPVATGITPSGVTVDPTGKFVYVTNQGDDTVSAYTINSATGALTALGIGLGNPYSTGGTPVGISIDPTGSFAYVVNQVGATVTAYTINTTTGALTALGIGLGNPFSTGSTPVGITIDPTGKYAYVVNQGGPSVTAYTINATTGALTALGVGLGNPFSTGSTPMGSTIDPTGKYAYVVNQGGPTVSAYTINSTTGVLTALAGGLGNPFSTGATPVAIASPGRP